MWLKSLVLALTLSSLAFADPNITQEANQEIYDEVHWQVNETARMVVIGCVAAQLFVAGWLIFDKLKRH